MSTPRELPGFYYDAERGRYFRIQPDHRAPQGAAHSRSAVNASRQAAQQADVLTTRQRREQLGRIQRISPSTYTNLNLRLRNGSHNSIDLLARHYAASLQSRIAHVQSNRFLDAITLRTGHVYCALSMETPSQTCFYWSNPGLDLPDREPEHMYRTQHSGLRRPRVGLVGAGETNLAAYIGPRLSSFSARSDIAMDFSGFAETVWDIAGTPHFSTHKPTVALATSNGLFVADLTDHSNSLDPRRHNGRPTEEQMAVAFQDSHIVMSGQRSGRVNFTDTRAPGSVYRIQHSSAVNGIATARTYNHIIVSGLLTTNMYDLRYTKAIDQAQLKKPKKQAKYHGQIPWSEPFVRFHVPDDRLSSHYGRGKPLAYLFSHDIAAVATRRPTLLGRPPQDRVTLYQASTGRVLQSPLTNAEPFAQIHDIAVGRVRDGPESIFVATARMLYEWNVDLLYGGERDEEIGEYELGTEDFPPESEPTVVELWDKGDNGPS